MAAVGAVTKRHGIPFLLDACQARARPAARPCGRPRRCAARRTGRAMGVRVAAMRRGAERALTAEEARACLVPWARGTLGREPGTL